MIYCFESYCFLKEDDFSKNHQDYYDNPENKNHEPIWKFELFHINSIFMIKLSRSKL